MTVVLQWMSASAELLLLPLPLTKPPLVLLVKTVPLGFCLMKSPLGH